jgi:Fe-S-cluster containining protein
MLDCRHWDAIKPAAQHRYRATWPFVDGYQLMLAQRKQVLLKFEKTTKVLTTHVCNGCGSCCRDFAYIRLSRDDIKTLENFTGLTSDEFTNNIDKAGEKRFMKFQKNGDCIFLNIIDGAYSCSVYEARSATCRGYPSTDIQRETCRVNSDR